MEMNLKHRIASGALALSLLGGTGAATVAQDTGQGNQGGAAGVVAAVVQANLDDTTVDVVEINDSLNNLTALNNFLNNSPITVTDVVEVGDIDVELSDVQVVALNNFLNNNELDLNDVVEVNVLSGGDLIVETA
jgi:hypothetical protein